MFASLMKRISLALISCFFVTTAMAEGNYLVRAGDTLRIEVLEDASLNRDALVTPDGRINFPFAGTVQASGRTLSQIERSIVSRISSNFATEPNVYVAVVSIPVQEAAEEADEPTIDIFLMGEVNSQGKIEVTPGTTLLQFVAETGGFTRFAATKRLQLRRRNSKTGTEQLFKINYHALANGASLTRDVVLRDGDVILVPERRLFE